MAERIRLTGEREATRAILLHADTHEDTPLIRCLCGARNLTITEHARHVAVAILLELAKQTPTDPGARAGEREGGSDG